MGESAPIVVKNGIKPALIYTTLGTTTLFKDVSILTILLRILHWGKSAKKEYGLESLMHCQSWII